jgi:F-type H+-transporting ATPase subunit epsilon
MADTFQFRLITPTGIAYEGPVQRATAIGALGQFAVLAAHTDYITSIEPGMLTLTLTGGATNEYLLSGGLAEVKDGAMVILALDAEPPASVDSIAAQPEVIAAEENLAHLSAYDPNYPDADHRLKLARARANVAHLHRLTR